MISHDHPDNDKLNCSSSMASHLAAQLEQLLTKVEELQLNSLHLVLPAWHAAVIKTILIISSGRISVEFSRIQKQMMPYFVLLQLCTFLQL